MEVNSFSPRGRRFAVICLFAICVALFGTVHFGSSSTASSTTGISTLQVTQESWRSRQLLDGCDSFHCNSSNCPRIVARGDFEYDASRQQWASKMASSNVSNARLSPTFIMYCSDSDQVRLSVNFAQQCGFKVSVRSGGHQYAGFSSCVEGSECIQLDVSGIKTFEHGVGGKFDRVTLGVGLTLEQVTDSLLPLGLSIPTGICKSVGVGGHFQSSSQGFLGRAFGLGMDHVHSFRMVKADGTVVTVSQDSDRKLYWAVLGGSPGSWGVVLDYTIDAIFYGDHPHTQVGIYTLPYTHDIFTNFSKNLMTVVSDEVASRDLFVLSLVQPLGPPDQTTGLFQHHLVVWIFWAGLDNGELTGELFQRLIQPLINPMEGVDALPAPFPRLDMQPMPLNYISNQILLTDFDHGAFRYHVHSLSTNDWFNASFLEALATELDNRMKVPLMYSSWQFQPYGGDGLGSQVNRNVGKNAFPVRDIKMHVDDWVFFLHDATAATAQNHIENFRASTSVHWTADNSAEKSWMTTDTTDTLHDLNAKDKFVDYFPTKGWFRRLRRVKSAVDPDDLFSSAMTIPPRRSRKNRFREVVKPPV